MNRSDLSDKWIELKGFSKRYFVSNNGEIKNEIIILKQTKNPQGYFCISLYRDGKKFNVPVHRLVAELFISPRPSGRQINHKDGNKINNNYINLEYITSSENQKHAYRKGLIKKRNYQIGRNNHISKLIEQDIRLIRNLYSFGIHTQKRIAKDFNVDQSLISKIIKRKIWKHVN